MNDWWKSPVLQGPENDYGQYDYMIEEIPENYARWEFDKYRWKCDTCGKERHLRFCTCRYFHTIDGWDSMSYDECWKCRIECMISCKITRLKRKVKNVVDTFKLAVELYNAAQDKGFKYCYGMAKMIVR